MADDLDRVQPIAPISGLKTYRVQPVGAEERPPRQPPAKKKAPRPAKDNGDNQCMVTADKVDCKI